MTMHSSTSHWRPLNIFRKNKADYSTEAKNIPTPPRHIPTQVHPVHLTTPPRHIPTQVHPVHLTTPPRHIPTQVHPVHLPTPPRHIPTQVHPVHLPTPPRHIPTQVHPVHLTQHMAAGCNCFLKKSLHAIAIIIFSRKSANMYQHAYRWESL